MKEHSKRNSFFFIPSSYCQEMNNNVQEEITKSDDDFINCTIPRESSQVSYFLLFFSQTQFEPRNQYQSYQVQDTTIDEEISFQFIITNFLLLFIYFHRCNSTTKYCNK